MTITTDFIVIEIVVQYHKVVNFNEIGNQIWKHLDSNLIALPSSITNNKKPPALLSLIHSFASYESTINIIGQRPNIVKVIILCVASQKVDQSSVQLVMDILTFLLQYENGKNILPYSEVLIIHYTLHMS